MPHILYVHDLDFNAIPKKRKVNPSKKYFLWLVETCQTLTLTV